EIEEDHTEFIAESRLAVNFRLQRLIKMTRIVKPGAIVSNCEFLNFLNRAGVINRDGGIVTERMQKEHLLLAKTFHGAVNELDHAKHAVLRLQRNADDRPALPLGHLINALGKPGIVKHIRHD